MIFSIEFYSQPNCKWRMGVEYRYFWCFAGLNLVVISVRPLCVYLWTWSIAFLFPWLVLVLKLCQPPKNKSVFSYFSGTMNIKLGLSTHSPFPYVWKCSQLGDKRIIRAKGKVWILTQLKGICGVRFAASQAGHKTLDPASIWKRDQGSHFNTDIIYRHSDQRELA